MRLWFRMIVFIGMVPCCAGASAQKRPITEKDLFAFHWIGDARLSPDGSAVAFVQAVVKENREGYETAIYLLDLNKPGAVPRLLTSGPRDTSPRWSPDGTKLAFLRSPDKDGKPGPAQVYLQGVTPAAHAARISDLPEGAASPQWSPKGDTIAVLSETPKDPKQARLEATQKSHATGDDAHVSDVRMINRAIYRMNGQGYLDASKADQVYLLSLPRTDGTQDAPWQVTGGRFGVNEFVWSPKSDWLLYTAVHEEEPYYDALPHNSIYGIHVAGAKHGTSHDPETPSPGFTMNLNVEAAGLSLSPDGTHLAFHAPEQAMASGKPLSHGQEDLLVLDLTWDGDTLKAPAAPHNLTETLSYEMGSGVGGDNTAPRGGGRPSIAWSADSRHLIDVAAKEGSALLVSLDARSGELKELTKSKQAVISFSATASGSRTVALISNPLLIGDLFLIGEARAQTQLTNVNEELFSQLDLSMPENLQVAPTVNPGDIHSHPIDAFVQLPPGFDARRKYPLILNIHGGPHSAYGWIFDHEMLWMAARGYVVVYPNPRGSTTYGKEFANVIEDNYPRDDFHDLMDTVDAVIQKGYVDPQKLGVTGGSGGGLLTDWTVTQTHRFKAAVAQRDIVDWTNWWATADIGEFHQFWMPEAPFDHPEIYKDHAPLTFVNNIQTPMMFILGDADYRTPPTAGGEIFFRALKYKKIPTVMIRFPRESHELSRSGEPWHRIERLENIVNWFDKYLMGICEPQYDIDPSSDIGCKPR